MRPLSATDVLRSWEIGRDRHPLDRALGVLCVACPEVAWEDLAALPVGARDAMLYELREQLAGRAMACRAACPSCGSNAEFTLDTAALRAPPPPPLVDVLEEDGYSLRFRLPNSLDLADVVRSGELEAARALLLERCLLEVRRGDAPGALGDVPAPLLERLSDLMAEQDPQEEVLLDLSCAACGQPWQALVDVAAFVWEELAAEARRLLGEVDALARAYHWREADILSMSSPRRQAYLEMAGK